MSQNLGGVGGGSQRWRWREACCTSCALVTCPAACPPARAHPLRYSPLPFLVQQHQHIYCSKEASAAHTSGSAPASLLRPGSHCPLGRRQWHVRRGRLNMRCAPCAPMRCGTLEHGTCSQCVYHRRRWTPGEGFPARHCAQLHTTLMVSQMQLNQGGPVVEARAARCEQ